MIARWECVHWECVAIKLTTITSKFIIFHQQTKKNSESFSHCVWVKFSIINIHYYGILYKTYVKINKYTRSNCKNPWRILRSTHVIECTSLTYPNEEKKSQTTTYATICAFAFAPQTKTYLMLKHCAKLIVTTEHWWIYWRSSLLRPLPLAKSKVGWLKVCDVTSICSFLLFIFFFSTSFLCFYFLVCRFALRNSKNTKRKIKTICSISFFFTSSLPHTYGK